jgi:PIN domain nuclease of toxin-antitoxin system
LGRLRVNKDAYLLDTHALVFWANKESVSPKFVKFFDKQAQIGRLFISSISFWEIALLVKKGRLGLNDIHAWKNEVLNYTNLQLIEPSVNEMIDATLLPDFHKDPFDRLLIAQANQRGFLIVTKDGEIAKYPVKTFWL